MSRLGAAANSIVSENTVVDEAGGNTTLCSDSDDAEFCDEGDNVAGLLSSCEIQAWSP